MPLPRSKTIRPCRTLNSSYLLLKTPSKPLSPTPPPSTHKRAPTNPHPPLPQHAFAHAPLHRNAWTWWEKTIKAHAFIGVNHEIYEAEAGHWENVYLNFQPTGLGATTYLRKEGGQGKVEGGIVGDEWIGPLVDARRGKMRSSAGRLGRGVMGLDEGRPTGEVYLE